MGTVKTCAFCQVRGVSEFEWERVADYTIRCRITGHHWTEPVPDSTEPGEAEPEGDGLPFGIPSGWQIIQYGLRVVPTDCGSQVALYSLRDGAMQDGFWFSEYPLAPTA